MKKIIFTSVVAFLILVDQVSKIIVSALKQLTI